MATSTLSAVLRALVDDYALGRRGTQTGTVASSFVSDADLGGPDAAKDISVGCQVLLDTATAREGDVRALSSKPKLSTGLANVDPDFGGNLSSGDTFIVLYRPLRFEGGGVGVVDRINQALREFQWEKRTLPITLVADGDMLASDETSWTVANATDEKVTATFPNAERVIAVTDDGSGGGYTSTGNIAVEENKSYYLETLGFGTDSSDAGTLVAYDVTNGAAITLANSVIDRIEPERLVNSFTTPSGCEQVDIRLICTNSSDVVSWAYVILRKNDAREFVLADRPQRVMKLGRLLTPVLDNWGTRGEWAEVPAKLQAQGAGMWKYTVEESVSGRSLWYEEFVRPATLSAGTPAGTTQIPAEDLAAVSAELILRPLHIRSKEWATRYEFAQSRAAGVIDRYLQQNQTVVNQSPDVYPLLRA